MFSGSDLRWRQTWTFNSERLGSGNPPLRESAKLRHSMISKARITSSRPSHTERDLMLPHIDFETTNFGNIPNDDRELYLSDMTKDSIEEWHGHMGNFNSLHLKIPLKIF